MYSLETFQSYRQHHFFEKPLYKGFFALALVAIVFILFLIFYRPHYETQTISIPEGYSIIQTGHLLKEKGIIRSAFPFRIIAQMNNVSVKAGSYLFDTHLGLLQVIHRLSTGDYGDVYVRVTLPEGSSRKDMAKILDRANLPEFSSEEFMKQTEDKEGYLFPDTYLFLPDHDTHDIVTILESNFRDKTSQLDLSNSTRTFSDIVIMASIIEKEANNNLQEMKMISGILWKRIDKGMLLQVDAPFVYSLDRGSSKLTTKDLLTDQPYNTYTRKGLTPTPIGNPGINAIIAALEPTDSLYFFYLHDRNGGIHYGKTHNEHLNNKNIYLK